MEMAARMDRAGTLTRTATPMGVPRVMPRQSHVSARQSTFFQTCGSSQELAAISKRSTTGTTSTGLKTMERLTTVIMENPNPL